MLHFTLVLPTRNEAENIVPMIRGLKALGHENLEIVVVDDHSPDGTFDAVAGLLSSTSNLRVLMHDGAPGLSPSVVFGFDSAKAADYLVCMDADGQHRPEDLAKIMDRIEGENPPVMVIGSRHVEGGGFLQKWNPFRVLFSRTAAIAARIVLGVKIQDPMSGFFAVRRLEYEQIRPYLSPKGFKIMLEIADLLGIAGHRDILEYPILFDLRKHGRSKLSFRVIGQYGGMLLRCLMRRRRLKKCLAPCPDSVSKDKQ